MEEISVKGITFISVLGALDDLKGPLFRERVIDAMPKESSEALRFGSVIASGWYPVQWYRELFATIVEVGGNAALPRDIGRASIRREVKGVHRLIFKVLSVESLQKQGARLFRSYFRPAELAVERIGSGLARTMYSGCRGFNANLWREQVGCTEEMLAQTGASLARVRVLSGGSDGDDFMELETRWR